MLIIRVATGRCYSSLPDEFTSGCPHSTSKDIRTIPLHDRLVALRYIAAMAGACAVNPKVKFQNGQRVAPVLRMIEQKMRARANGVQTQRSEKEC